MYELLNVPVSVQSANDVRTTVYMTCVHYNVVMFKVFDKDLNRGFGRILI